MKTTRHPLVRGKKDLRNNSLADRWSVVHFATGVLLGWTMNWHVALLLMVAWEPLEILVLSPALARVGIDFGYETWRNSLSDIAFDTIGVLVGYQLLTTVVTAPIHLF